MTHESCESRGLKTTRPFTVFLELAKRPIFGSVTKFDYSKGFVEQKTVLGFKC